MNRLDSVIDLYHNKTKVNITNDIIFQSRCDKILYEIQTKLERISDNVIKIEVNSEYHLELTAVYNKLLEKNIPVFLSKDSKNLLKLTIFVLN